MKKYVLVIFSFLFSVSYVYSSAEPATTPGEFNMVDAFLNMLFSLGFIVLLLLLAGWFLKRILKTKMTQANEGSRIKIIERRGLAPKSNVYLLDVGGKGLVVGESSAGLQTLMEVNLEDIQAKTSLKEEREEPARFSFSQLLQGKLKGGS
jgi:flagellar biogenesis protein FliO